MSSLLLMLLTFSGYIIAYRTYGRYLSKKIFNLNDKTLVPSRELEDGVDFVPTKKGIIFGHHYTSIAGTGPIVGPAIGIIWGWVPALIWVFVGSIVMGAVHDFGALVISLRNHCLFRTANRYSNFRPCYCINICKVSTGSFPGMDGNTYCNLFRMDNLQTGWQC